MAGRSTPQIQYRCTIHHKGQGFGASEHLLAFGFISGEQLPWVELNTEISKWSSQHIDSVLTPQTHPIQSESMTVILVGSSKGLRGTHTQTTLATELVSPSRGAVTPMKDLTSQSLLPLQSTSIIFQKTHWSWKESQVSLHRWGEE